jgi:hypothetical protein
VIELERPAALDGFHVKERAEDEYALRSRLRSLKTGAKPPELNPIVYSAELFEALARMTGGRCAYCERAIVGAGGYGSRIRGAAVTHHRPPWGAVAADGMTSIEHYWWLAYTWSNLLPACSECIRAKGNRFPVEGNRARRGQRLSAEGPLLLDPCVDDPAPHLLFQPDGIVVGSTPRGSATVEVLALNRSSLVSARRRVARQVLDGIRPKGSESGEFQGLRRQFTALRSQTKRPMRKAAATTAAPLPQDHYDLDSQVPMAQTAKTSYYGTVRWIERVRIRNFRPIRDLDLDFSGSTSEQGPWRVLLGENGSGKSSVLQAIALALIGGSYRRELGIAPERLLRYGSRQGSVEVHLTGSPVPLRITFDRTSTEISGPEAAQVLLLGYGATRLLPRPGFAPTESRSEMTRVDNLFNPFLGMTDPTTWLLGLPKPTFKVVADGLLQLLDLPKAARLVADHDRREIQVRQGRDRSTIEALSDGYQSMLVLACDVMNTVLSKWTHVTLAEGIVLIDELGAHLHPRWRMRIVGALRELLPRVQFVVTTHDPLCLRGVLDGEVTVIRRSPENQVVAITDLPPVQGMRVDQLLTSEHFGLGSTDDPVLTELWSEFYRLDGLRRPTAADRAALDEVRRRLDALGEFGRTERERLLLRSADAYVARRRAEGDPPEQADRTAASAAVDNELAAIWAEHLPVPRGR